MAGKPDSGNPSELQKQLFNILEAKDIRTVFQPIVSLRDGTVLGYEALSRGPSGTPLQNPDALFGVAAESGKLWELEQLCRGKALENAFRSAPGIRLFLNVDPRVIHAETFQKGFTREYLSRYGIDPENITFEITEKSAAADLQGFGRTIEHYRKQNYQIAIDDAGAGYSGLNLITDIRPDGIKLDIKLIHGIDGDVYKKTLVKSLYEFCRLAGIVLIAEGVETEGELEALIDVGVQYAQGYLIQRPEETIRPIEAQILNRIRDRNSKKNHLNFYSVSNLYIGNLSTENPTVTSEDMTEDVYDLFLRNDPLSAVAVVKDGKAVGIVTRTRIDHFMSGQFGYSLHARHPIGQIMNRSPLTVDYQTPIDTVSKQAMSRPALSLYDLIIITKDGSYYGIVTIRDLLEKAMEIEVSNAKHLNPLSGLPGNQIIESSLAKCVNSDSPYTVLYIDLDNFKAYNDVYGFENGDGILRFVANILGELTPKDCFIGHVGGDDFLVVLPSYDVQDLCRRIISRFDDGIRKYYSAYDLKRGYLAARNRRGEEEQFPIMSLSIAGVTNRSRKFGTIYELSEYASELKKECKRVWQSCFVIR